MSEVIIRILCFVAGLGAGVMSAVAFAMWDNDREDFSEPWYEEEQHERTKR